MTDLNPVALDQLEAALLEGMKAHLREEFQKVAEPFVFKTLPKQQYRITLKIDGKDMGVWTKKSEDD